MKLKRILSAVAAFALCASLAGCGASASSVAESTAESASTEAVSTVEEEASPETSARGWPERPHHHGPGQHADS